MHTSRVCSLAALTVAALFVMASQVKADDSGPATPEDVHKILREALGDGPDSAPPVKQQQELLDKALKTLGRVPHVYHGALFRTSKDLSAALADLGRADGAEKARGEILDADEIIRTIM